MIVKYMNDSLFMKKLTIDEMYFDQYTNVVNFNNYKHTISKVKSNFYF